MKLLGEDDFTEAMNGSCRKWREGSVKNDFITSFDGTKINYYYAFPEQMKAIIVMFHGFCEFWGKYHEMAWYFYSQGYGFFFPEMRGHGLSGGKLTEKDLVHVKNYDQYVSDMKLFYDKVVSKREGTKILFAHSMGGAVAAIYLENYPSDYKAAILSSPMLRLKTGGISPAKINLLRLYVHLFHKEKQLSVGQHHFDGVNVFETSSCQSKARYDYLFGQRLADEEYQTYGATFGWSLASLSATKELIKNAGSISTPLLVFEAGNDHLVDPTGYTDFLAKVPQAEHIKYETSKHEIFNSTDDVRADYYKHIFDWLKQNV
ncbi:MAG: alpha/beta fold hydrolase [Lachnospiraceae bacterium]|nr:alpha/beta fold hydrolase [Lachnospiraceae bacterium]